MNTFIDPLLSFRDYINERKTVLVDGKDVVFGNTRYSFDTPCGKDRNFTVGQILCFLKNKPSKYSEYVANAKKMGQAIVTVKDQKSVLDILTTNGNLSGFKTADMSAPVKKDEKLDLMDEVVDESLFRKYRNYIDDLVVFYAQNGKSDMSLDSPSFPSGDLSKLVKHDKKVTSSNLTSHGITKNKKGVFEKVLATWMKLKQEEKVRKTIQTKKDFSVGPSKGNFDEKVIWKTKLGGTEHEDLEIDTTGSLFEKKVVTVPKSTVPSSSPQVPKQVPNRPSPIPPKKEYPILIVPTGMTSCITIYNARELLEKEHYKSPQELKNKIDKKTVLVKMKNNQNKITEYLVLDDPCKLSKSEWDRVVGIFTNGQTWQFKGWPLSNPTDIFSKYKGFYLHFDDEEVKPIVRQWPLKILKLNKNPEKRYLDHYVVSEIAKNL
jgi:hypothetical protein